MLKYYIKNDKFQRKQKEGEEEGEKKKEEMEPNTCSLIFIKLDYNMFVNHYACICTFKEYYNTSVLK